MSIEVNEEIRRSFHLFWDNFPAAVILAYKDRTIIEVNKVAQDRGYPVGVRCMSMGETKHHAGCKLHIALSEKTAVRDVAYYEFLGQVADSYWIPLAGAEDFFVHFATDITEYAADRLFPGKCGSAGNECGSCSAA
ncbi:hypothetical protein [Geotalea uraniireducens]|jgi:hypothetical protein|uniref:Uncharacterized protein n=1 Tax=Geotalea uraniireducens TaxID=351604 RepID=A0ABN6VUA8_9BACT|nr:hypothetical protein [Geotalea uraniireducens]BDV42740.1 hypothetical protein GURASL_16630 [Geotalea uraniireducens]